MLCSILLINKRMLHLRVDCSQRLFECLACCTCSCRCVTCLLKLHAELNGYLFSRELSRMYELGCTLYVLTICWYWGNVI